MRSLLHQLFWMLFSGNSHDRARAHRSGSPFLSLQGLLRQHVRGRHPGAVVGVGLLRNLGGIMSGMVFSGILAARMIPELRMIKQRVVLEEAEPAAESSGPGRRGRNAADPPAGAGTVVHVSLNRLTGLEDRGGGDWVHLAFTLGHHGRHGGRLERRRSLLWGSRPRCSS